MATGALDANGIWQYGEDDSEATFSALLNKLGGSTSTTVTRLEEMGGLTTTQAATARSNLRVGLVPISPTTVTAVTGTATANTLGQVSFSGCTKVVLDGVFSSDFKNYKLILSNGSVSGYIPQISFRYVKSGTEQSGTNYTIAGRYQRSDGVNGNLGSSGQTLFALTEHNTVAGALNFSSDILDPFTGLRPTMVGTIASWPYPFDMRTLACWYDYGSAQSLTGISLFSSNSNTLTGTLQILGYND